MKFALPKSFAKRLALSNFISSLACVLTILAFHLAHSYLTSYASHKEELNHQVSNLTADFLSRIESLRMDALFLASVPPIQGIRRATVDGGTDRKDNSTLEQWKDRLAVIFEEMLLAKPHYLQVRFIGVAHEGKELVRVEWRGTRLQRTTEKLLQSKGKETFFQESIETPPNNVYLSEFSLNREWGKVEAPPRMVIRAAVPIPDPENKVFGILVINMLAKNALAGLLNLHKQGEVSNIYNSKMEPLLTSSEAGGWIRSKPSASAGHIADFLRRASSEQPLTEGRVGDYHVVAKKIYYDPLKPDRFLGVTTRTPMDSVYAKVLTEFSYKSILAILLVSIAMLILFLSIQKQTRPLRSLRELALRLSKGEDVPRPAGLSSNDDEMSELATAFYDMADEIRQQSAMLSAQKDALDETALVSETDRRGRITYANKKFAEIAGYSVDDLVGSSHRIVNSGYHSKEFFEGLWRSIESGRFWRGEVKNKRKNGSYFWLDSSVVPFKGKDGKIEKYISIGFDITDKKEQENQLKELTEAKSKFLAVMSHEIRTPLGAVIGLSELLASTELSKEQKEYVDNIGYSADILLNILNDILDLSKLNSGQVQLHPESASIHDLGKGIANIFKEKALEKNIDLTLEVSEGSPEAIEVDTVRFKQILINLVSNAIKFTHHGYVRIHINYLREASQLEVEVKDSGIGMTQLQLESVFNEFVQADSSTTKNYGGTGLGLPICKKITEAMGGQISVESIQGEGTTFRVVIPAKESSKSVLFEDPQQRNDAAPKNLNVLFAEDYQLNQTIFTKMVEDFGVSISLVDNGAKAVSELEHKNFDIIFLDIQMPVMDGMEACQKIRKIRSSHRPWIVALTANAFREDVEKYGALGFDDYIPKPFSKKTLKKAFSNFTAKTGYYSSTPSGDVNKTQSS